MLHQFNIFLLLFGALQGWLLSLWFFRNQKKHISNLYLALILFIAGLQLTSKVISKMWLMDEAFLFYALSYKLPYLIGPALYFYCRTKNSKEHKTKDLLHLAPFVIMASCGWIGRSVGINLWPHPYTEAVLQSLSLLTYSYFSFNMSNPGIRPFIKYVAAAEMVIIITLSVMVMYYGRFPDVRLLFVVLTGLIYWISWKVISRSDQFSEAYGGNAIMPLTFQRTPKYAHSSLKPEEADRIEALLQKIMNSEQLYLDQKLTIDTLASRLSTTRHNLSQVINERLKKTYADFITDFRLEESRKRICDSSNSRFTIAAIAQDSGFNSVSTFNDMFKKRYGITPSAFRDQHLKKMTA
jgi:AraC-like DNA-binding protein